MGVVLISEHTNKILQEYLFSYGHTVLKVAATDAVYPSISSHPDIYICIVCDLIISAPELKYSIYSIGAASSIEQRIQYSSNQLSYEYPGNIKYNAVVIGNYFLHNLDFTSPDLLKAVKTFGLTPLNVKQGYTKCNTVIVDERSLITEDRGIEKAACSVGIDVLTVEKGQVKLEGFDYGFLGGASGAIGNDIVFNGDLSRHTDFKKICDFIKSRNKDVIWFEDYELTDIGSIIFIEDL